MVLTSQMLARRAWQQALESKGDLPIAVGAVTPTNLFPDEEEIGESSDNLILEYTVTFRKERDRRSEERRMTQYSGWIALSPEETLEESLNEIGLQAAEMLIRGDQLPLSPEEFEQLPTSPPSKEASESQKAFLADTRVSLLLAR